MARKPPKQPPPDPAAPELAVKFFRDRLLMTDEEFNELEDATYKNAFTMADVNQLDLVTDTWKALDRAIANGETLEDFKKRVSDRLASAWGGEQPWRVETIFRTNAQTAYSAGRYVQMNEPAVKTVRPFKKFSAILDTRTSLICSDLDETILPADDPFWSEHVPPLHFSCRSQVITLTDEEANDEGIDPEPPNVPAQEGFGEPPEAFDPEPDFEKYPQELVAAYKR